MQQKVRINSLDKTQLMLSKYLCAQIYFKESDCLFFVSQVIISPYALPDRGRFLQAIEKLILKFLSYAGLSLQGVSCGQPCAPCSCTETVVLGKCCPPPGPPGEGQMTSARGPPALCSACPKAVLLLQGILGSRQLPAPLRGHLQVVPGRYLPHRVEEGPWVCSQTKTDLPIAARNMLANCYATRTNLLESVRKCPWQISRLTETFLLM